MSLLNSLPADRSRGASSVVQGPGVQCMLSRCPGVQCVLPKGPGVQYVLSRGPGVQCSFSRVQGCSVCCPGVQECGDYCPRVHECSACCPGPRSAVCVVHGSRSAVPVDQGPGVQCVFTSSSTKLWGVSVNYCSFFTKKWCYSSKRENSVDKLIHKQKYLVPPHSSLFPRKLESRNPLIIKECMQCIMMAVIREIWNWNGGKWPWWLIRWRIPDITQKFIKILIKHNLEF